MENWEKEYLTSRIIAGEYELSIDNQILFVRPINRVQKFQANVIYKKTFEEAKDSGVIEQSEALALLIKKGLWSEKKQEELDTHIKNLDDLKVKLYESWDNKNVVFLIQESLRQCEKQIDELESEKSHFDYWTCESVALYAKYRYIIGSSIYLSPDEPYWKSSKDWDRPDSFVEIVTELVASNRIGQSVFRELARNDPWNSFWNARDHSGQGLFNCAAVDLTDEQKIMISWSNIYETVRSHSEAPEDSVVENDDAFDGWMIIQRRKNKKEEEQNRFKDISMKVKNSNEVFVMAKSVEDVELIHAQNDKKAKSVKERRMKVIADKGEIPEQLLPDTILKNKMKMNRLILEKGSQ